MKSLFRHVNEALGKFVYQPWEGSGQIIYLGVIENYTYYLVDTGVPLPLHDTYEFQALSVSADLAPKLRALVQDESLHTYLRSAVEVKSHQLNALNEQRDIDINAGVTFKGHLHHSSNDFLLELLGILFAYQLQVKTGLQKIRTLDNQIIEMEYDDLVLLAKSIGDYRENIYETSWAAKDAL